MIVDDNSPSGAGHFMRTAPNGTRLSHSPLDKTDGCRKRKYVDVDNNSANGDDDKDGATAGCTQSPPSPLVPLFGLEQRCVSPHFAGCRRMLGFIDVGRTNMGLCFTANDWHWSDPVVECVARVDIDQASDPAGRDDACTKRGNNANGGNRAVVICGDLAAGRETADLVARFVAQWRSAFDACERIFVERQPPGGMRDIEQLLYAALGGGARVSFLAPNSLHAHFRIGVRHGWGRLRPAQGARRDHRRTLHQRQRVGGGRRRMGHHGGAPPRRRRCHPHGDPRQRAQAPRMGRSLCAACPRACRASANAPTTQKTTRRGQPHWPHAPTPARGPLALFFFKKKPHQHKTKETFFFILYFVPFGFLFLSFFYACLWGNNNAIGSFFRPFRPGERLRLGLTSLDRSFSLFFVFCLQRRPVWWHFTPKARFQKKKERAKGRKEHTPLGRQGQKGRILPKTDLSRHKRGEKREEQKQHTNDETKKYDQSRDR
ncbi:hypothetical protein TW95_gp1681 [Pandoravirus inopinatum]|uniref:Uncharacterized protein n=1 Tax=Pandoravirus inopinatum TaxID=1605721 RepID=A0A0B5J8X8_9VIRU|nr:hypothetical protein TW95_gp1681 [Pandoravirus inopinatum]AJF98415.1 hypothetical protein [Pandoravirus inopinatum]